MYRIYTKQFGVLKRHGHKFILIMRLTTIILIATMLQVSAVSFAQRITYVKNNVTLIQLFKVIKNQTGYKVVWYEGNLDVDKTVNANFKDSPVKDVMDQVLKGLPLSYSIEKQTIVIKEKEPSLLEKIKTTMKVSITIQGKVTDTTGAPLVGATIQIKGQPNATFVGNKGLFTVSAQTGDEITISFIGYQPFIITIKENMPFQDIVLHTSYNKLNEVVVSTGYQTIPKERATGSFVLIDNALLNRKVGINILDRLDGITSGLIFNKNQGNGNNSDITIRGRSTLFANPSPLIVLDNFPYDGDINNINPNDIENITVLKDAASASIWGVRAGNGVIVITTKKGKIRDKVHITFNTNTTVSGRPNLHYRQQMSSSEYIDLEQYLYKNGAYSSVINNGYGTISPAVAIILQKKSGKISATDSATSINQLKTLDVRNDLEKYIYRPAVNQQYAFSLDGGNQTHLYYLSAGYDKNLQNLTTNSYGRFTLTANNTYYLANNKVQLTAGVTFVNSKTSGSNSNAYTIPYTPYDQLADANGNHLSVVREGGLSKMYTDTAGKGALLDWNYRPLDENYSDNTTTLTDYRLNTNIRYTVIPGLDVVANYQYQKGITAYNRISESNSFYTRNLINTFTQLNQTTLVATRPIPLGAINNSGNSSYYSNYGRMQINYSKKFAAKHDFNALAGVEIKDYQATSRSNTMYGFNASDNSSIPVNNVSAFPYYYGSGSGQISSGNGQNYSVDRFLSEFAIATYTYAGKYIATGSARRDESNIFGVKANQKGVPLWSAGLMWNLSDESFYPIVEQLPILKIRATYGYNGNVDRSTTAYLTAQNAGTNYWNASINGIINPPNPALRWEKVRNINLGIDYAIKGNLISGSIDYFIKQGIDLIGNSPIAPQTGAVQFKGNSANTKTTGIDFTLNKNSITNAQFKWQSAFLFSYNNDIITSYKVKQGSNASIVSSNYVNPLEGFPYYAIFSYPYKGLDNRGKPQGMLNGVISENYSAITNSTNASELVYNGSATPTLYGSFRNNFSYRSFDLSINIIYKLNYYFRRPVVFNGSNYTYLAADYDKRWQAPGDEQITNIPALIYPADNAQAAFFNGSSLLVEKGDHIRLQDIRLSYNLKSIKGKPIFKNIQLYVYANNIGVIWKATKLGVDPDFPSAAYANPKTISFGLNTNF